MTPTSFAHFGGAAGPAREHDFRRLWLGYSVSSLGSEVTVLALPVTAAVLLGASALQMGILTAAATVPNLAIGLLAGVWVDRLPRRRPLLVVTDLASTVALLSIPVAWWIGRLTVTQLVVVELAVGTARVLFRPAYQSHLPQVVARAHLTRASGHLRSSDSAAMLAGPGLGGVLVQAVSAPVAILLDAASFLVSAACIRSLRRPERCVESHADCHTARDRSLRADLGEGLRAVLRNPPLRAIAGSAANLNLFAMLTMALFVAYATRSLGLSAGLIGAIAMIGGAGALAGALAAPRIAVRMGEGRTIVAATIVFSFALFALPLAAGPRLLELGVIGAGELVGGFAVMLFDVTAAGLTLKAVAPELLGRVSSCSAFLTQGVKPLGALAGGVLGTTLGLHAALWIAAVGATTTMLWTFLSPLRHRDGAAQTPTERIEKQA
ncbi:MFS transporter [Terrabacter sp. NPDC080008]|uniref:MFS transporter n=1 Tax=Terrabacter sp. NPDC080008 TaxID=3155176 RepID=UPI00344BFB4D